MLRGENIERGECWEGKTLTLRKGDIEKKNIEREDIEREKYLEKNTLRGEDIERGGHRK